MQTEIRAPGRIWKMPRPVSRSLPGRSRSPRRGSPISAETNGGGRFSKPAYSARRRSARAETRPHVLDGDSPPGSLLQFINRMAFPPPGRTPRISPIRPSLANAPAPKELESGRFTDSPAPNAASRYPRISQAVRMRALPPRETPSLPDRRRRSPFQGGVIEPPERTVSQGLF